MYDCVKRICEEREWNKKVLCFCTHVSLEPIANKPFVSNKLLDLGYIVMLRARLFRSLIPVLMIKERNIRARNITI